MTRARSSTLRASSRMGVRIDARQRFPIQLQILRPFGDQHQRIGVASHLLRVATPGSHPVPACSFLNRSMATGSWAFTRAPRSSSWRATSSAGASRRSSVCGLNARPSRPMVRPLRIFSSAEQLLHHALPLAPVDFAGGLHDGHIQPVFGRGGDQRGGVFAEARSAPADAGLQEARADARVEADAARHLRDIRAHLFGQLSDFVDVADLERQERVGRVLDQLGRSEIGGDQRHAPTRSGRGRNGGG